MEPDASGGRFQADHFGGLGERDTFQHSEDQKRAVDRREFAEGSLQATSGLHSLRIRPVVRRAPRSRSEEALITRCRAAQIARQVEGRDQKPGKDRPIRRRDAMALAPEFKKGGCRDVLSVVLGLNKANGTTIDAMAMQIEETTERLTVVLARSFPQLELGRIIRHT